MSKVVAIRKSETGSIDLYKLDNGQILTREQICAATNRGEIEGVSTFTTRDGDEAVRSDRGQPNYSLSDLPQF